MMTYKKNGMKNILKIFFAGLLVLVLASCGNGSKDKKGDLTDKKAQLEKLKKDQKDLADKIAKLEDEIAKSDTSEAQKEKAKLVSLSTIGTDTFAHYIDLQGKISAENVAYVTPRGQGGLVKAVYVKQGDYIKKGQLLLKLDNALAERQIEGLQTQLAYAKDIYQRQQNLWNQGIGTEVQLLNAKNSVDNLEKQIASAKEQLSQSNVYAEMRSQ